MQTLSEATDIMLADPQTAKRFLESCEQHGHDFPVDWRREDPMFHVELAQAMRDELALRRARAMNQIH